MAHEHTLGRPSRIVGKRSSLTVKHTTGFEGASFLALKSPGFGALCDSMCEPPKDSEDRESSVLVRFAAASAYDAHLW